MFYKIFKITEVNYQLSRNANESKQYLLPKNTISDKREFVDGVLRLVAHEDDLKDMCDWIDKHPYATESEIICKALELNIPRTEPERIIR